jgi:hypothetical protein
VTNVLNSPTQGFRTFGRQDGGAPTQGMTPVWINSTDAGLIFRGDPVLTSSFGGSNNSGAYITSLNTISSITASTAAVLVRGIFQGCYQFQPAAGRVVWSNFYNGVVTGSTGDVKAYVVDDPQELFIAQASTKNAITSSMIGLNMGVTYNTTTGNTTTGYSNITLEACSVNSGNGSPFRLVDFYSAYAPTAGTAGTVTYNTSVSSPLVNGTDNANVANIVVVRLNNCDRLSLTARSGP